MENGSDGLISRLDPVEIKNFVLHRAHINRILINQKSKENKD